MNDYIVFDGVDSRTFGVYLFDRGNDNAPERIYSRYEIPAKNGDLLIDEKRYENVIVQYDLIAFGAGLEGRVQKFKDFMKSRIGYKRLEDSFRPEEYYMACQAAEIEVAYDRERERCKIELTFDRQPQRFLKVGETQVDADEWGDTSSLSDIVASFYSNSQRQGFKSITANITSAQEGGGDPSPTNIRPIGGWTGCTLYRTGKNILWQINESTKNGVTLTPLADGGYYIKGTASGTNGFGIYITSMAHPLKSGKKYYYNINAHDVKAGTDIPKLQAYIGSTAVFTKTNGSYTCSNEGTGTQQIRIRIGSGESYDCVIYPCMTVENPDTTFEKGVRQAVIASWEDEAGTVYGGNFDLIGGVLTVTHGYIASYNGEALSGEWISDRDVYSSGSSPTTGAQVVYELATPVEHILDSGSISALLGDNNVWADTGTIEVEYGDAPNRFENPSMFDAYPLIRVEGAGTVTIGNNTITISENDGYTDIDCQLMEAYKGSTSRNAYVSFSGFEPPSLKEGVTTIGHSSGITSVKVIPRWWRL